MAGNKNTFPKKEHLYGEALVDQLYEEGASLFVYPYRAVYRSVSLPEDAMSEKGMPNDVNSAPVFVRCLFSAPKKRFKHAVDRNRLKRQMREAYRKNKHALVSLFSDKQEQLHLSVQYVGQKLEPSVFMEKKMVVLLGKLAGVIQNTKKEEENHGRTEGE